MTQSELLDHLEADLRETLEIIRTKTAPLDPSILQRRPSDPKRWNVLECFDHLNRSSNDYIYPIELAIHKAKARQRVAKPEEPVKYTLLGREAIRWVTSPPSKRFKTSKRYNPIGTPVAPTALKAFIINAEKTLRIIQMAREVDINRTKVPFAVFKLLKYRLGKLLEFIVRHNRRLTEQALRLLAEFGY